MKYNLLAKTAKSKFAFWRRTSTYSHRAALSIIRVCSVPFCILDEVEAALDEANVKRFGRYLSDFQDDTQFIVVTHRKGTMVAADVLYGVTMQESGVSKIVSVRMEDINEEAKINETKV